MPSMENGARTLSVADRLEIQELLARYNFYEDSGQVEPWVNSFTTDGGFMHSSGKSYIGHDELRRFALDREKRPGARQSVHWASNLFITPTAEGAQAQYYVMLVEQLPDGSFRIRGMSRKTDELRQENGQWRFKFRGSAPLPDAGPSR